MFIILINTEYVSILTHSYQGLINSLTFVQLCILFLISLYGFLDNSIIEPKMSASFVPDHKAPMVLFLDRVYGIDNQDFLLHVLEVGFLPDMRAAASLDTVSR